MYDVCNALDIDYDAVRLYTGMDPRITDSHTQVTKQRGFGGHCFPKDIQALIKTAQHGNVELSLLKEAVAYNRQVRKD